MTDVKVIFNVLCVQKADWQNFKIHSFTVGFDISISGKVVLLDV